MSANGSGREETAPRVSVSVSVSEQLSLFADGVGLSVVLQPIIELGTGRVVGLECLARFDAEPGDPGTWFAEAASQGMRPALELAAIRVGLACLPHVPDDLYLSINVSPDVALTAELTQVLAGAPLDRIVLEVTEQTRIEDFEVLNQALRRLRARGLRIALDDTGAGFAGLTQLLQLRPDIIKLDIDVVRGVDRDEKRRAMIASLMSYAGAVGGGVIAEGVETREEAAALRQLGVRFAQGYGLARPQPPSAISFSPREPAPRPRQRVRTSPPPKRVRTSIRLAAVLAAVLVLAGPTQAIASNALPGSPAWPVKRAVERLRLILATDPAKRAAIHLELASRRANELTLLIAERASKERTAEAMSELMRELASADDALARAGLRDDTAALLQSAHRNVAAYVALVDGALRSVCGSGSEGACGEARTALAARASPQSNPSSARSGQPAGSSAGSPSQSGSNTPTSSGGGPNVTTPKPKVSPPPVPRAKAPQLPAQP